jgi:hypothetical protein
MKRNIKWMIKSIFSNKIISIMTFNVSIYIIKKKWKLLNTFSIRENNKIETTRVKINNSFNVNFM